jgi:hypothetical protein
MNMDGQNIPVGFHSVRLYRSIVNGTSNVEYDCSVVLDGIQHFLFI